MTDEGPIEDGDGCLGVVINRNKKDKSFTISQNRYLINILKIFNIIDCKPVSTPLEIGIKLTTAMSPTEPQDIETMKAIPYSTAVGSLLHAMTITRIDIAYSNSQVSKFMANPSSIHWSAIKCIMRYIKGTLDFKITYEYGNGNPKYPHQIQGWSN